MDEIRADYEALEGLSQRFLNQAQVIQQMLQDVRAKMGNLQNGGWIGRGSDAFFNEMDGEVLPASDRLQQALDEGGRVTKFISQTIEQAEEEACNPFRAGFG